MQNYGIDLCKVRRTSRRFVEFMWYQAFLRPWFVSYMYLLGRVGGILQQQ